MSEDIFRPFLSEIKEYTPGKNPDNATIIKLASNENPFGPSPLALKSIDRELKKLHIYPDQKAALLRDALGKHLNIDPNCIVTGNGSDDIMQIIGSTFLSPGEEVIIPNNSFSIYLLVTKIFQGVPIAVDLKDHSIDLDAMAQAITDKTKIIFLTNPHNPCGTFFNKISFDAFINKVPENVLVVVDEAYFEFAESSDFPDAIKYIRDGKSNIIILRTFSKFYGLAGLRIGYGISAAENIAAMTKVKMPFNTNRLAQAGARAGLEDKEFLEITFLNNLEVKKQLYAGLDKLGLKYKRSDANFVFVEVQDEADAMFLKFMSEGIIIRPLTSFGFPYAIRVSIGTAEQNNKFLAAFAKILKP